MLESLRKKHIQLLQQSTLVRTFGFWNLSWSNIRKSRQLRTRVLTTKCIKIWSNALHQRQSELETKADSIRLLVIKRSLLRWHRVLLHRKQLFEIGERCTEMRRKNLLRECYTEWNIQMTLKAKCKEMIDRRRENGMNRIFEQWIVASYSSQITRKAISHHRNKLLFTFLICH